MLYKQKLFAILIAVLLIAFIIFLIRRRKLREEYAILWLLTGFGVLLLVSFYDILVFATWLIGAIAPTTTLFIFSLLFLMAIAMHFSIKISQQADQIRDLTQEIAMLRVELEEKREIAVEDVNNNGAD